MKKFLKFQALLMLLLVGVSSAWATEEPLVSTFSSVSSGKPSGTNADKWTFSQAPSSYNSDYKGVQVGTSKSAAGTWNITSSETHNKVAKVDIIASTGGAATITSVTVGTTTLTPENVSIESGTGNAGKTYSFAVGSGIASGTITINFNATSKAMYVGGITVTYGDETLIVPGKETPTLTFDPATVDYTLGDTFTAPTLTTDPEGLTVTYSVGANNTANVDVNTTTGEINFANATEGTATIIATFAGNEAYKEATAEYTLNILPPSGSIVYVPGKATFDFTKDKAYGMSEHTNSIASGTYEESDLDVTEGEIGLVVSGTFRLWNTNSGSSNTNELRLHKINTNATTNSELSNTTLTFTAPEGYAITEIKFDGSNLDKLSGTGFTSSTGTWEGKAQSVVITRDISSSNAAIKTIEVSYEYACVSIDITSAGIATFCSTSGADFSKVEGITAYTAVVDEDVVNLSSIDEVPANLGVILMAEEGNYKVPCKTVAAFTGENALVGVTVDTEVPATEAGKTNYLLARKDADADYAFYRLESAHTLAAGKAYLSILTAKKLSKIRIAGQTTGIENLEWVEVENDSEEAGFNMFGLSVDDTFKGIVIKNGKKVLVK